MTSSGPDLSRLKIDRAPAGASRAGWIVAVALLLLFGAYVIWREELLPEALLPKVLQTPDNRPAVSTGRVLVAGGGPPRSGVAANGYVVARRRAALSTDIQGRIVEIKVEEGDRVAEGQLVARLDTRQLEASLATAEAQLAQQDVLLADARRDYDRYESLVTSGEVSVSERDDVLATLQSTEALVASLKARILEIDVMIDKSSVYAPFSGRITAKNAEVGEVVAALGASGPTAGGAVATLVDFDTLEVQVELAQTSLGAVREGKRASIWLDAWPDEQYPGQVRQIWPTANRQKATVEVRIVFAERDDRILPEMGCRVVFSDDDVGEEQAERRVLVPAAALLGPEGARAVLLVVGERLVRREVELSAEPQAGQAEVAAGLTGGETVVLDPDPALVDGMLVRVPASED
jgi:RND family efflux transporter MFP subunit